MSKSNHFKKYGGEADDFTASESRKDRRALRRAKHSKRDEQLDKPKHKPQKHNVWYADDDY